MSTTTALLHHKLERAIAAWLTANKGDLLAGYTILPAHTNVRDVELPYLVVACMKARPHPEFDGCGRGFPQLVEARLHLKVLAQGNAHETTVAVDIGAVDALISARLAADAADYTQIISDLNPPASGPDGRTIKPLFITAIHPDDDAGDFEEHSYDEQLGLQIIAQNGEPDTGAPAPSLTADSDTITADSDQVTADAT
jgi:hypothetical protein